MSFIVGIIQCNIRRKKSLLNPLRLRLSFRTFQFQFQNISVSVSEHFSFIWVSDWVSEQLMQLIRTKKCWCLIQKQIWLIDTTYKSSLWQQVQLENIQQSSRGKLCKNHWRQCPLLAINWTNNNFPKKWPLAISVKASDISALCWPLIELATEFQKNVQWLFMQKQVFIRRSKGRFSSKFYIIFTTGALYCWNWN